MQLKVLESIQNFNGTRAGNALRIEMPWELDRNAIYEGKSAMPDASAQEALSCKLRVDIET
jgi:hypothetical protein